MINKIYQKSVLDAYNTSSQTLTAGNNVAFNGVNVDSGTSINQTTSTDFVIYHPGIYGVRFVGNVYNSSSSPVEMTMSLTANGTSISGTAQTVTVAETGYDQIIIAKDILVKESTPGTYVTLNVNSTTASVLSDANIIIERKA